MNNPFKTFCNERLKSNMLIHLRSIPIKRLMVSLVVVYLIGLNGCKDSDSAQGNLNVTIDVEDLITDGISSGSDTGEIQDGWTVNFDQYLIHLNDLNLTHTQTGAHHHEDQSYVVDLKRVQSGSFLWAIQGLEEGRWDFNYTTSPTTNSSSRHESVSEEQFEAMKDGQFTYWMKGTLSKEDGESCPPDALREDPGAGDSGEESCFANTEIRFSFPMQVESVYGPCEVDGLTGVAIVDRVTQSAAISIHGDHFLFNGFPEGSEGGISRLAQWLADCDLNGDGEVTQAELERIKPQDLVEFDERFQLGGSPITPIDSIWTYIKAQLMTQGHFQGEGECPINGQVHDHGHDDHDDHDDH